MLTVKQASARWGVSPATVRRYCRKGYLRGARKRNGAWRLPEGAQLPYVTRKKSFSGQSEKNNFVLMALESGRALDFRLLPLSSAEFERCARMLLKKGYVEQCPVEGKTAFFTITQEGCERVEALRAGRHAAAARSAEAVTTLASSALSVLA